MAVTYITGTIPTKYMSFASWVGETNWGSLQSLNSNEKDRARKEYNAWLAGLSTITTAETITPVTEPTSTTIPIKTGTQGIWFEGQYLGDVGSEFADMSQKEQEAWIKETYGKDVSGQAWGYAPYMSPEQIATIPARPEAPTATAALPTFGEISEIGRAHV